MGPESFDWQELLARAEKEWEQMERTIRQRVEAKFRERVLSAEEARDLQTMEIPPPVHPNWVRPFFYRPILPVESLFYTQPDVNIRPELLYHSSRPWLARIRRWAGRIIRFFVNIDLLVTRQAHWNNLQAELNDRLVHHTRLLHQLIHHLVTELTRLRLAHDELAHQVEWLSEQLEWYRQRHRVMESWIRQMIDTSSEASQ